MEVPSSADMKNSTINNRDIDATEPLCILGNVLAIVPPYKYLTESETLNRRRRYKWYTFIVFLLLVCGNAISLWGRFKNSYPSLPTYTLIITDLTLNISVMTTNALTVLVPTFCQMESFISFKKVFFKIDDYLIKDNCRKSKKCKLFYIELVLGHIFIFLLFSYDCYVWLNGLGMTRYRNYIFRYFQYYHLYITMMIMYNLTLSMQYRFKGINNKLQEISNLDGKNDSSIVEKRKVYNIVRQISQLYEQQLKQVNLFNKIFGWQLLFMTFSFMMGLINALDIITVYIFIEDAFKSSTFGIDLIILSSICSLWQFGLGVIVTVACNKAWNEAQNTANECFSILLKLPVIPESNQERALQDEVTLLNRMSLYRCPVFTAAGLFTIDYPLLIAILGSLTSYVIVLIQFNK